MNMSTSQKLWLFSFATAAVLMYLINIWSGILTPFVTAAILAYLADPLVNKLVRWRVPRTAATVLVFVAVITIVLIVLLFMIPMIERQVRLLIRLVPQVLNWLQHTVIPLLHEKFQIDIDLNLNIVRDTVMSTLGGQTTWSIQRIVSTVSHSGLALLSIIVNLLLVPVVMFYLLRDWHQVLAGVEVLLPRKIANTVLQLSHECDEVLGAFLRGQLLVMIALGIIYAIGLWLGGLQLGLLIGLMAGALSIVPYLGFVVGIGVALVAALFQFGTYSSVIFVLVVFGIGQTIESSVLTPILVGDRIGLHPVAVIFAIMAGGNMFGFVGVLLALPVASVIMVLLRFAHSRYVNSDLYSERVLTDD